MFASLDAHYNNSVNTEVDKQNKPKERNFKKKVVDSIIIGIHCNIIFKKTSSFSKYAMRKLMYTLQLHLQVSSCSIRI